MTTTVLAYIPSPSQGVWHIGPLPLRAYALFIIVGIVAALVIGDRRWEARGGERGVIYDIALWAVPFGLIGGRLYHVITDWRTYFADGGAGVAGALRIWDGGLGIWGAVALGGVGAWIACRRRGIPLPAFGDAIAPGIVLAQAIGRLGNYFNQELYGRQTTLPWGLEIYQRQDASGAVSPHLVNGVSTGQLDSVVHPTFLYELLWNLLLFAVLIYVDRRFRIGHGRLFALYVAGYCLGRFWIELMRSDAATHIAGIRINSFTATFVFIGAVVYIMAAPKGREDPATLRGKPREGDESFVGEELAAVAATAPVLAAAKVASDSDEDDAKAVAAAGEDTEKAEIADEAEELGADVAGVPADDVAEAEEFAAAGEDEHESEAAVEAETLTADVEDAPAEDIAEAEEFAVAGEDAGDGVGGVGAVEGEDAVEAEQSAQEVHEAAVERAAEAEEVAAEAADESAADVSAEGEPSDVEAEQSAQETHEPVVVGAEAEADAGNDVGGVGAVEGEDAVEAEQSAGEVHEAVVAGAAEAEEVAAEAEAAAGDGEPRDDVGGVGAVEGEDAVEAEQSAGEVHEAVVAGAAEAEEVAAEAEAEAAEADVPADDAPETDEAAEPEAAVEAETLAEQVDEAPAEKIAEAEEFAAAGEEAGTDTGGVGAVEGEDAIEAEQAAEEAHQAAVEGTKEAERIADETTAGRLRRWVRNRRSR